MHIKNILYHSIRRKMAQNENHKEEYDSFESMGLKENILRGIFAYGFETPSTIQKRGIVPISQKNDVIAQSQSGTGKTATFSISSLQVVDEAIQGVQVVIVAPTRELANQISNVCGSLGHYTNIKCIPCIGGTDVYSFKNNIANGPIIIAGTPGRIIDMINRGILNTKTIRLLVLDEADEMLSQSFTEQIKKIIFSIPQTANIALFSATMPSDIISLTTKFLRNPVKILVKTEELTLEGIKQYYIDVMHEKYKTETLCDIYNMLCIGQSIIYVNTKKRAEILKTDLENKNFTVSVMHSEMNPEDRSNIMKDFRDGTTRILVSTDLLSRGIDIQQVSIVINYDLPNNKDLYLHRIGRSGRFGRKGIAINFATQRDAYIIGELESYYSTQIQPMPATLENI